VAAALSAGFSIRPPRIEDVAEVADLMNSCARAVGDQASTSVADILLYWNDPERNLEDEDWLVIGPDARIAAFMESYESDPFTVFEFDCHVHPDFGDLGIEQVLYEIAESRARREMIRAPEGERVALITYVSALDTITRRTLEAHGYTHIRDGLRMLIDLDTEPAIQMPPGISIRPFIVDQDDRAVWETAEDAWQDLWGYSPMPFEEFRYFRIEAVENFDPTMWHLAYAGAEIAGVAICRAGDAESKNTGYVSLLGVRREYRGRGIGLALLHHAFADFHRRGYAHVGLGVDASSLTGADRLYRRAGMREISREFIFEKELRPATIVAK
jgi:ribosomal protein S18 acetylase RimI-like enzyme